MSIFGRSDIPSILLIADSAQPPFSDALASWSAVGTIVAAVTDVYSAMALLSEYPSIRHVLIDVRNLDPHERAFLQLAPRYYPNAQLSIADLPGAATRMRLEETAAPLRSVAAFVAATLSTTRGMDRPLSSQNWPVRPAQTQPPSPDAMAVPSQTESTQPLSTDGSHVPDESTPSLHEAVRRRMAGQEPGSIQRKPPIRTPPRSAQSPFAPATPPQTRSPVSPQELDALLAPGDAVNPESNPGDGNTGHNR